ncbi:hypothetical protein EDB83DRAFT_2514943 [Lactarius deliciosus]|nr:hypothetical protein EDB83DRAFT_2514943 [Lactarius deliciosus]
MSSHSYEIALFGEFLKGDLKPVLNRVALHSESAHQMHSYEVIFDPPDAAAQREANQEPALLRAKKELLEPDAKWLRCYIRTGDQSPARIHPEATVRPWATVQVVGDALGFASALGYIKRSPICRRGYILRRGKLTIQIFQEEQVDAKTQEPIPAHADTLWQVIVKTANPVRGTQEVPLSRHIEAVLEVQALMKGLIDLRRQDV